MKRFLLCGLFVVPVVGFAQLPKWQQVRLVGSVSHDVTSDGVVFRPDQTFGCIMKDETKPLEVQDSPYDCGQFQTQLYLYDGTALYPPVEAKGTVADGLVTTWADWGLSIQHWGSSYEKLKLADDGTVQATLYAAPIHGGCVPTKVSKRPSRDRSGQRCLSHLGEVRLALGPGAVRALDNVVKGFETSDAAVCQPSLTECETLRALKVFANCSVCAGGYCDSEQCSEVHNRAITVQQELYTQAAETLVQTFENKLYISEVKRQVYHLIGLLTRDSLGSPPRANDAFRPKKRTELKHSLGRILERVFEKHLEHNLELSSTALSMLKELQGTTGANQSRDARIDRAYQKRAAARKASSSSSSSSNGWRSLPVSDRINCMRGRCPACNGSDLSSYGGDLQACFDAFTSCARACGCTNTAGNTPAEWCQ